MIEIFMRENLWDHWTPGVATIYQLPNDGNYRCETNGVNGNPSYVNGI